MSEENKNPAEEQKPAAEGAPQGATETLETPAETAKQEPTPEVEFPRDEIVPGMTVKVYQKITETNSKGEEKERVQVYEGLVIARRHGKEEGATITVRKISEGVGVEKILPLNMPSIVKIVPIKQMQVRRAKLDFIKNYKKKIKEVVLGLKK